MRVTYIDSNEMVTQCNLVNDELKQQNEVLNQIDDVIIQAIKEEGLKGFAWDAIKELFTNHDAFIKLIILANEKLVSANEKLMQGIGSELLDRRQIESNISNLQSSIVNNQKIIATYKNKTDTIKKPSLTDLMQGNVQTINMNLKAIEHLRKKIEMMDSIERNTANLYKEAVQLYGLAEKGIEILKSSWNGSTYIPIQPHDIFRKTWAVNTLKLVRDTKQKENELDKMIGNIPVELTNEIEKLRSQYKNGEITEAEAISKLLKYYGVDGYISQPSYSAAFGKKYNPEKKRELVGKVAMALIYVKGGESYIDEQYKEYEDRYSKNFYDKNKLTHNTSYGVLPVDNPPKIPREEYFKQLVLDEVENVGKQAYSGEKLENDLAKAASAIVDGILIQRAYNKYGQIEKPSVEDVPKTKVNNPKVLDEPEPEIKTTNGFAGSDANASGRKIITSTIGNEIDITPSSNHISVNKNPGPYGEANTSVDILDANGNIKTRRWYDSDGKAYRDVDMSDHGNPKEHPEVPHEHTWEYNNGKPKRNQGEKMKGCIIKNDEISMKDICNYIGGVDEYNWLITNIECYPSDEEIVKIFENEYCWIDGKSLLDLLSKEDFQWIWGVFSAFPKEIKLEEVLKYDYPYADGYKGFWKNPIALQHPLAVSEIVAWDGSLILVISKKNEVVNEFIDNSKFAQDLEKYNMK